MEMAGGERGLLRTLTASLLLSFVPIAMLRSARKWSTADPDYQEHGGIFKLLEYGSWVTFLWVAVFGYFRFNEVLPPYTYIYGGLIWCFVLRLSMQRYEFLNHAGQRYKKCSRSTRRLRCSSRCPGALRKRIRVPVRCSTI